MRSRQRTIGPEPDTHRTTKNGNKRNYRHCSAVCPPLWLRLHKSRHGHGVIIIIPICGRRCRRSGSSTELCEKWTPLLCADGVFFVWVWVRVFFACFALRALHHDIIMMCACQAYPGDMGAICWAESAQWWATTTLVPVWPGQKGALSLSCLDRAVWTARADCCDVLCARTLSISCLAGGRVFGPKPVSGRSEGRHIHTHTHTMRQQPTERRAMLRWCCSPHAVMACAREHEHISFVCAVRGRVTEAAVVRAHFGFAGRPQHGRSVSIVPKVGGGRAYKICCARVQCVQCNMGAQCRDTHARKERRERERERDIVVTYLNDYYSVRIAYLLLRGHACSIWMSLCACLSVFV